MHRRESKYRINTRTQPQWKLHQQIAAMVNDLDRLPDAQEVRDDQPRSAPLHLLPMVF